MKKQLKLAEAQARADEVLKKVDECLTLKLRELKDEPNVRETAPVTRVPVPCLNKNCFSGTE